MRRRLFNLTAAVSVLLCIGFIAVWIRSHLLAENFRYANEDTAGSVWIQQGAVCVDLVTSGMYQRHQGRFHWIRPADDPMSPMRLAYRPTLAARLGFRYERSETHGGFSSPFITKGVPAYQVEFPLWACVVATAFLPLWSLVSWRRRRRRAALVATGRCSTCGYDLRASPSRCPECGNQVLNDD